MPEEMDSEDNEHGCCGQPCAQCALPIADRNDCVECFGRCKLSIHVHCLPGATNVEIALLQKIKNAVFVCDACLSLAEFDDRHCEKRLDEIAKKLDDFAGVAEVVKNLEKVVQKVVCEEIARANKRNIVIAEKNEKPRRMVTRSSAKRRKIDECENQTEVDETPKSSYAEVVKIRPEQRVLEKPMSEIPKRKPDPVVVIKPKPGVQVEDVRAELRKKVDARHLNVKRVASGKAGEAVIALKDEKSVLLLKENVEKNMGGLYEVNVRESLKPTIKLIGMSDEMDEQELKETLVDQNEAFVNLKHFRLCKTYCNQKLQFNSISAIIELDAETFNKVMLEEKLNCGWDRCRVFDGLNVTRCYNCCAFNHKSKDCKSASPKCPICSGDHLVNECQSKSRECANCNKMNTDRKLRLDTNHAAWSVTCPVYQRQLEQRKSRVDYSK